MLIIFPEKMSFVWIAVALEFIHVITFCHWGYSANKWIFKGMMELSEITSVYCLNKANH